MSRWAGTDELFFLANQRVGDWGRRLMHLVPAPAVRLMKRRVQSWPGARQENRCSLCLVFRIGHIVFHGWRTGSFPTAVFSFLPFAWPTADVDKRSERKNLCCGERTWAGTSKRILFSAGYFIWGITKASRKWISFSASASPGFFFMIFTTNKQNATSIYGGADVAVGWW